MIRLVTLVFAVACLNAFGQVCEDNSACNFGSEGGCDFPEPGLNCAGECLVVGEDFTVTPTIYDWGYETYEFYIDVYANCPIDLTENFILSTGGSLGVLYTNDCETSGSFTAAFNAYDWIYDCCEGVEVDIIYVPNPLTLCAPQVVASFEVSCAEECGCLDEYACNYDPSAYTNDYSSCEYDSCFGCMDETACNFDPSALIEGPCQYDWCAGCTEPTACNYDYSATIDDGSCLPAGCMDVIACNYDAQAVCQGFCDYSCCPGPGCCGLGTTWNWQTSECEVTIPSDSNFDGCVQLNDLLDLLGAYGDCGVEESVWQCGDALEYQGYDYATVLIGDQCWFAENLRSENYNNGDAIPSGLSDSDWLNTTSGAMAVYGENAGCESYSPDIDACDPIQSLNEYGRLYNWYAVDDARGLCPSDWHVPTDGEWITMEMALGMSDPEANGEGWRGTNQGTQMKTDYGWDFSGNGTNSSGFSGLPSGALDYYGVPFAAGSFGYWWSSEAEESNAWFRQLHYNFQSIKRNDTDRRLGFSVRCVRDAE